MLKNLLRNWKTTSAGLGMIISSTVHLIISVAKGAADETTWTTALMGIVGGVGLLAAGDYSTSDQAHKDSTAAISELKTAVTTAVQTGDTSVLAKADIPKTTT